MKYALPILLLIGIARADSVEQLLSVEDVPAEDYTTPNKEENITSENVIPSNDGVATDSVETNPTEVEAVRTEQETVHIEEDLTTSKEQITPSE